MENFFHSVALEKDKCKGCINCIKRCPTEAIRVRDKKAVISPERCIDCGECVRICQNHAKKVITDHFDALDKYKYKIALPAPALYAQFNNLEDIDIVLKGLLKLGFDDVYQVAKAAELVSLMTREYLKRTDIEKPVISSACPAVTRLIRVKFPNLIDQVLPINAPVEIAARLSKKKAAEQTGLDESEIAAVFISPCAAKVTAAKMPLGCEKSQIDVVLSVSDVYPKLIQAMKEVDEDDSEQVQQSGRLGISWGLSSGEASALFTDSYLAADGIENVIKVLEDLEDDKFSDIEFIELNACNAGCIGGILNVENPYIARTKLKKLRKYLPIATVHNDTQIPQRLYSNLYWEKPLEYSPVMELDPNIRVAMHKLNEIEKIEKNLPGIDCGSCGCPSCRAFAEDVVKGNAVMEDCVHKFKDNISILIESIQSLEHFIPESYKNKDKDSGVYQLPDLSGSDKNQDV